MEYVIKRIIKQGSTVVKADILSVLEDYHDIIETLLQDGINVITPTANYRVSIKGTFAGRSDSFDPSRHQVVARVSTGARLRRMIGNQLQVSKVPSDEPKPIPQEYIDTISGEHNGSVTPGGPGMLLGLLLKFDPADPNQGIFFVSLADKSETPVETLIEVQPGKLIFLAPALPSGQYRVVVRATLNSEEVREGFLKETLTVA
jgi:hypothetical protein